MIKPSLKKPHAYRDRLQNKVPGNKSKWPHFIPGIDRWTFGGGGAGGGGGDSCYRNAAREMPLSDAAMIQRGTWDLTLSPLMIVESC